MTGPTGSPSKHHHQETKDGFVVTGVACEASSITVITISLHFSQYLTELLFKQQILFLLTEAVEWNRMRLQLFPLIMNDGCCRGELLVCLRGLCECVHVCVSALWSRVSYLLNRTLCTPAAAGPSPASQTPPFWCEALGNSGRQRSL